MIWRRRDLWPLLAIMAAGLLVRVAYVLATQDETLLGDAPEYDSEARFIADGKWFWTTLPYGVAHAGAWKAPLYPAWAGVWYDILGKDADNVRMVQALLGPLTIGLTYVLGHRLFGRPAGLAAAGIVAIYPLAWQFDLLLYPEVLATPIMLGVLILVLERAPTLPSTMLVGVLLGVGMLVRPTSFFTVLAVAAGWALASDWKMGLRHTAIAVAIAALIVIPWTARNQRVFDGFVPISLQDAAAYGTFNDEAASDDVYPWAWRPIPRTPEVTAILSAKPPLSDVEFRRRLNKIAREYVKDHPSSVGKAFFWNGLSRTWDVRRPQRPLDEARLDGRKRWLTGIGLAMYYVLLPLALFGLWRMRERRGLVVPVLGLALGASLVFTVASATRYRVPMEPLIVVLACGAVFGITGARRSSESQA